MGVLERQEPRLQEFLVLTQHRADKGLWVVHLEKRPRGGLSHLPARPAPPEVGTICPDCPSQGRLAVAWEGSREAGHRSPEPRVYIQYITPETASSLGNRDPSSRPYGDVVVEKNIYKMAFPNV